MRTGGWLLLALVATSAPAAPGVRSVEVRGLPDEVGWRPRIGPGDTLLPGRLADTERRLGEALSEAGYLSATWTVDSSSDTGGRAIVFSVAPGAKAVVGRCRLSSSPELPAGVEIPGFDCRGLPFSRKAIEQKVVSWLVALEEQGHPLADISVLSVEDSGGLVFPLIRVDAGPQVAVLGMAFSGAKDVDRDVLRRTAGFRAGLRFAPGLARAWERNLDRSGLVRVKDWVIVSADTVYGIEYRVEHRASNRAAVAVSYSQTGSSRWSGLVDLRILNVLNTGRRLAARWEAFAGRTAYGLEYTEPWLFGSWLSLTGTLSHEARETLYSHTTASLAADLPVNPDVALQFNTAYERSMSLAAEGVGQTYRAGTGLEVDTRSGGTVPDRGVFLGIETSVGQRRDGQGASYFIGRVGAEAEVHGPSFGRVVLANAARVQYVHTEAVLPEFELPRMGGAQSVRGYSEGAFVGRCVSWLRTEVRYRIMPDVAAFPFFDTGVMPPGPGWTVAPAYGVGARVGTSIGVLALDYGVATADSPLNGKVHLAFIGEF